MLYLDTSALVKLYLDEPEREAVVAALSRESVVATHEIAYIEAHAAFSRAERESRLDAAGLDRLRADFEVDWPNYLVLRISQALLTRAVKLVDSFALRAYDALHLAAAESIGEQSDAPLQFACFDRRLNRAAEVLGMALIRR
jgi:uncharacterized protein